MSRGMQFSHKIFLGFMFCLVVVAAVSWRHLSTYSRIAYDLPISLEDGSTLFVYVHCEEEIDAYQCRQSDAEYSSVRQTYLHQTALCSDCDTIEPVETRDRSARILALKSEVVNKIGPVHMCMLLRNLPDSAEWRRDWALVARSSGGTYVKKDGYSFVAGESWIVMNRTDHRVAIVTEPDGHGSVEGFGGDAEVHQPCDEDSEQRLELYLKEVGGIF